MAGKVNEGLEREYFTERIEPHLSGLVHFRGEVDHETKAELYKRARCTLFPIQWPEPFGLVMIESLACGTPVIAFRHGSVPEVIEHGRTGFIVDTVEEMVEAAQRVDRSILPSAAAPLRSASAATRSCARTSAPTRSCSTSCPPRRRRRTDAGARVGGRPQFMTSGLSSA